MSAQVHAMAAINPFRRKKTRVERKRRAIRSPGDFEHKGKGWQNWGVRPRSHRTPKQICMQHFDVAGERCEHSH